MSHAVEIRSYNLKPGTRAALHALMTTQALPMLRRWKIDVLACGSSPHDEDSYYLIRAYRDLEDRQRSQDAFYGSDEWRNGLRTAILALIDTYTSVVLTLDADAVEALRQS